MRPLGEPRHHTLRHRHRLHGKRAFDAVFDAQCRKHAGPLAVLLRPNGLSHGRLGLVVPRRVGTAVQRHHIKRLLREAFRLDRHDYPASYDIVVIVRPHAPTHLDDYRRLLADGVRRGHRVWERRGRSD